MSFKKSLLFIGIVVIISCGFVPNAHALTFSAFVDYGTPDLGPFSAGSISVPDTSVFSQLFDLTSLAGGDPLSNLTFQDASLRVWYRNINSNASTENWNLFADGAGIGNIVGNDTTLAFSDFSFGALALAALQTDGKVNVEFKENTSGSDSFQLYQVELTGHYTHSPEPATMLMFGLGSLGLACFRRKKA